MPDARIDEVELGFGDKATFGSFGEGGEKVAKEKILKNVEVVGYNFGVDTYLTGDFGKINS